MSFADQIPQSAEAEHHLGLHKAPDDLCSLCAADNRERKVQAEIAALRIENEALKAQRDELLDVMGLFEAEHLEDCATHDWCPEPPPPDCDCRIGELWAVVERVRAAIAKAEGER